MESEGYVLVIDPHAAYVVAATGSGVFYGVQTLKQLLPLPGTPRQLPTGTVRDWPAMRYRGIDDDLSRGPFPTLDFQKHQIRVFAVVQDQHLLAVFREHAAVSRPAAGCAAGAARMTPAEVAELVAYARKYHITIIPEQEAFGHLHQVLKYDLYADVAETPHGQVLAPGQPGTSAAHQGLVHAISPRSFPRRLFTLARMRPSTWAWGAPRTRCRQQGYGPVYMAFLKQIHDALAPLNRRLLFWGDIGDENPGRCRRAAQGHDRDSVELLGLAADSTRTLSRLRRMALRPGLRPATPTGTRCIRLRRQRSGTSRDLCATGSGWARRAC